MHPIERIAYQRIYDGTLDSNRGQGEDLKKKESQRRYAMSSPGGNSVCGWPPECACHRTARIQGACSEEGNPLGPPLLQVRKSLLMVCPLPATCTQLDAAYWYGDCENASRSQRRSAPGLDSRNPRGLYMGVVRPVRVVRHRKLKSPSPSGPKNSRAHGRQPGIKTSDT